MGDVTLDRCEQMSFLAPIPVQRVPSDLAEDWCRRWHYSGRLGSATVGSFGVYRESRLEGIVVIGHGGNRFGVAEKFGLERWKGDVEITRVVVHPDAPRNTASRSLAAVSKVLAVGDYEWVYSYSDTEQDHHGGIYQAVNAVYVGTTARQWVNFALDGEPITKRVVATRFGSTRWPEVEVVAQRRGHRLERVSWFPKHTYILPITRRRTTRRAIRRALEPFVLPYPKRGRTVSPTPYRNHRPKVM